MTYVPTNWQNEAPQSTPLKYKITDDTAGELAASAKIELVTPVTAGTPVNATNLNKIEQGIVVLETKVEAAAPAIFTAKGDLAVATGAGAETRLPVGANGKVLMADSTEALGVKWGDANGIAARMYVTTTRDIPNEAYTIFWFSNVTFSAGITAAPGSTGKFTILRPGIYRVGGYIIFTTRTWEPGNLALLVVYKNGALETNLDRKVVEASFTELLILTGSDLLQLAAGDEIDIRLYQKTGGTIQTGVSCRADISLV